MKVCITSTGPDLSSQVDPRFGRCSYFLFIDTETGQNEAVNNDAAGASGGAGIQSARFVAEKGTEAVITGNFGPNATSVLQASGVKMIIGAQGVTVEEALRGFQSGAYKEVNGPSVESHFGMKSPSGGGMGMGSGRGQGSGGGMGMGSGRGQGSGRGMGQGGGRGMGMGMGVQNQPGGMQSPGTNPAPSSRSQDDIASLKEQAKQLEDMLVDIKNKISSVEKGES